jgi:hypothetical protein
MRRAILAALLGAFPMICIDLAAGPAIAEWSYARPMNIGIVEDRNPTRSGLHDYVPPTPIGRGHGNAYFGAGYVEFLFSGGSTPRLPPKTVYAGPLESWPHGNRRLRLRAGQSPRAGTYMALPEHTPLSYTYP